jgi:hypothetical protein
MARLISVAPSAVKFYNGGSGSPKAEIRPKCRRYRLVGVQPLGWTPARRSAEPRVLQWTNRVAALLSNDHPNKELSV